MTKKERIIAAIEGRQTDGVPAGFSLHFPDNAKRGTEAVEAHLRFFQKADMDMIKIMNEYRLPIPNVIRTPEDYYETIPEDYRHQPFFKDQLEMTKQILARTDQDAFTVGTLHGICSTGFQPFMQMGEGYEVGESRQIQVDFLRWNEKKMLAAMERIADGLCDMAATYVKEAGVDGIYYASQGGATKWFTDDEFARWIRPFDLRIMQAVKDAGGYLILHICQSHVNMNRYDADYAALADAVNWGVYDAPMSLSQGRKHFRGKTLFGGLPNRSGVLVDGDETAVRQAVQTVVKEAGRDRLILGADCTLSTEQNLDLLRAAVEEAHRL